LTSDQIVGRLTSVGQQVVTAAKFVPVTLVRNIICALIGLWVLAIVLQLAGLFVTAEAASASGSNDTQALPLKTPPASAAAVAKLQQAHLFGEAGATPIEIVKPMREEIAFNATKTRLNLSLEGIVHTPDDAESIAVIVSQGKQDQYYIGDKLPAGSNVKLARVFLDHVILNNAGRYESLWLYDQEKNSKSTATGKPITNTPVNDKRRDVIVTDKRSDSNVTSLANDYRDKLYTNPKSLAEVLRISPAQKEGKLIGYRVSPGKDRSQFSQLGFESNDIVTSVNGIVLDEPSRALEIYKLMRAATEATFTVDRNGDSIEVLVSLQENADAD
jgi:general secretion pathway protein C